MKTQLESTTYRQVHYHGVAAEQIFSEKGQFGREVELRGKTVHRLSPATPTDTRVLEEQDFFRRMVET
jgi:hypothetical protein